MATQKPTKERTPFLAWAQDQGFGLCPDLSAEVAEYRASGAAQEMDDLFDAGLWAAHDLQSRLNLPGLGFTANAAGALREVIAAVDRLKEVEGWDGCDLSKLPAKRLREVA